MTTIVVQNTNSASPVYVMYKGNIHAVVGHLYRYVYTASW